MSEVKNTLREANNIVVIVGKLKEKNLKVGSKDGKTFINGNVVIKTGDNAEHKVTVFVNELTSAGKPNSFFAGLKTVISEYKSIAEFGEAAADIVKIMDGKMGINDYVGQDGRMVSLPEIKTMKINRVTGVEAELAKFKAKAQVEVYIDKVRTEVDGDQMPTGRLMLDTIIPLYGGKIAPITMVMTNEQGIALVQQGLAMGQRTWDMKSIELINGIKTVDKPKEVDPTLVGMQGFGDDEDDDEDFNRVGIKKVRDILVKKGEPYPADNAKSFAPESIEQAKQERAAYLAEKLRKHEAQQAGTPSANAPTVSNMAFGVNTPMGGIPTPAAGILSF